MTGQKITVLGAGITGLWQALTLREAGHEVLLCDDASPPFTASASWYAGAMLAPYCEEETSEPLIRRLGLRSLEIWKTTYPDLVANGSLVVAQSRDRSELERYSRMTGGHKEIGSKELASLEPDLEGRFSRALYYSEEAHLNPRSALDFLLEKTKEAGIRIAFGCPAKPVPGSLVIDCRGMGAAKDLKSLRGVKGEQIIVRTEEINLNRPVRLLHPRFPLYVVPWPDHHYMIGATVIESEERNWVSVRSALELLSTAYALHPAFGEAGIVELGTGVRPAFPDNIPKIVLSDDRIYVNGLYRHGFLLAPALAEIVANHLNHGMTDPEVFVEYHSQW